MKKPILLVHGFGGGKFEYLGIIWWLKNKGYNKFYQFTYKDKFGQVSIKNLAKELEKYIKKNIKKKEIVIIGISQGGIIAEYHLKKYNTKKVKKLFTICTPHHGTYTAFFSNKPGFINLRPNSKLLSEINTFLKKSSINIYSVYTPLDLMVFPGSNAKSKHGKIKRILAPLHPLAFFWPGTLKFISENI